VNGRAVALQLRRDGNHPLTIVCECGDLVCVDELELSRGAYRRIRRYPTRFAVAHGHDDPQFERIVSATAAYTIVQKPVSPS
jgi:hypothetical protein